jgi:leader peptidase (prepilin peptidase)/N-methyltransferase
VVELATALVFVAVVLRIGWTATLPAYLYLAAVGLALALIDLDTHRLPDPIVLPAYPVLGVLLVAASWAGGDWPALLRAVIGGAALWVLYFVLASVRPGGMGFGDVKLAGVLGAGMAWLSWGTFVIGAFGAFLLGGLFGIALIVARRADRTSKVPFGPWMVLGAAVGIAAGEWLWTGYLDAIALAAS